MKKLSYYSLERLKPTKTRSSIIKISLITALIAISGPLSIASFADADRYDQQINQLKEQNSETAEAQGSLEVQEENLSAAIASIRSNIASIESQIRKSKDKKASTEKKIVELEGEIKKERKTLGVNIKQMYLEDDMTTIEKLASSKNLSEYVDREQYRVSVQAKIQESLDRISSLKDKQEEQRIIVTKLLKDQESMQSDLASQRTESERLLQLNRSQQSGYASEVRSNNARIAELRRQQAIENSRHFISQTTSSSPSSSGGGIGVGRNYPWENVPFPNAMPDPWGMYKRQCVSYTAWRVANSGRHMPYWGGRGNAKLWDDNARAAGIPVDYTPRVGSIAVSNAGTYGHVMYVEAVHGDGTISISDYNSNWDGRYREGRRSTTGLVFVHFR